MTVSTAYKVPQLSDETLINVKSLLRICILGSIAGAAVASRLFAVLRFESIVHEFDPWFNYRATRVLTSHGFYEFWNWFDKTAWYPLGRVVGGTVYPGIMVTSGIIYNFLHALNIPVNIRDVCVMLAPAFSGLTAYATYLLGRQLGHDGAGSGGESTGLWAALFIGIAPGYISRSVAGSYDNEAIAIFILMFTFYLWLKALKDGSALYGALTALFYFYMVAAWGGFAFITNMLPIHAFALLCMGRYTSRLYVAYSTWYAVGTLSAMQVPFVGFQPIRSSEHMAALGVFGLLQLVAFAELVRGLVPSKQFKILLRGSLVLAGALGAAAITLLTRKGWIAPWTGRFYSLFDTGYAKIHIPIIASVSEHQPTAWPSFFFDLNILIWLFPAGVFLCFRSLREEHIFVILYSVVASYFAGVMVRLMLTLTPVVCLAAAMTISRLMETYLDPVLPGSGSGKDAKEANKEVLQENGQDSETVTASPEAPLTTPVKASKKKTASTATAAQDYSAPLASTSTAKTAALHGFDLRLLIISFFTSLLVLFVLHCTWVTQSAYSSPSVVLASRNADGSQHIIDDFREAYYWIRSNTKEDAKVMSCQIAGFADRTTLVDNNTWNNTHIATVGKAMCSREEVSYPILKKHDVDYVLIIFGGLIGFSGDDINKYLWMIRIAEGVWPNEVKETNYFTPRGEYKIDGDATPTMRDSLMYKMSFYRFPELFGGQKAVDRVRQQEVPSPGPTLDILNEVFTSENWIVRIYEVKKEDVLSRDHKSANGFDAGKRKKKIKAAGAAKRRIA